MNTFVLTPTPDNGLTPVQQLAIAPQRVRTDEGTVEERPIKELLQADVYNRLDQQTNVQGATIMSRWGISIARTRPPDALGQQRPDPWGPRFL